MDLIENKNFSNEEVSLDDRHFQNCRFINCVLAFSGGEVTWDGTQFEGCKFRFIGAAARTAQLLDIFGLASGRPSKVESTAPKAPPQTNKIQ
jgi:hypothetical protein